MSFTHRLDVVSLGKIVLVRERLMEAARRGQRVYRLESGDPSFDVPPHVVEAMAAAGRAGRTHYGPTCGIPELRAAARRKLAAVNGIALDRDEDVYVTNGAMHGLFVAFAALLDEGDEVLLPDPMWTEVAENVRLAGGVPVGVPLVEAEGFAYTAEAIARRVGRRTRAIYLNTPHNPTGAVLGRDALVAILDVAARHGLWLVSDEAYEDVVYAPATHVSIHALAQERYGAGSDVARRCLSIFSFSKSHAMSGLRVGLVAVTDPQVGDRLPKIIRCTINNVNSLAQWGAVAALDGPRDHLAAMRDEYQRRRDVLVAALRDVPGVRPFVPAGGFMLWAALDPALYARLGVADAEALCDRLADQGIGSAPGNAFAVGPGSTHAHDALRFSFSCATPMVEGGAAALREALLGGLADAPATRASTATADAAPADAAMADAATADAATADAASPGVLAPSGEGPSTAAGAIRGRSPAGAAASAARWSEPRGASPPGESTRAPDSVIAAPHPRPRQTAFL